MLNTAWEKQCQELLQQVPLQQKKPFNLVIPHSHCPNCKHTISWRHNIPLLSFLLLRGKCAYCQNHINKQYPTIELSCALLSALLASHYGITWQLFGALLFTWSLISLFVIDFKEQLLPDEITLPLLWGGLVFNIFNIFTSLTNAVIGAIAGYLILWSITHCYKLLTQKQAMGHGDFKLLAAIGAWLGWQILPLIVFIAAALGIVCGLLWLFLKRKKFNTAIAFGPYLAVTAWFALFFNAYFLNWQIILLP